jgi:hypothetical protein
MEYFFLRYSSNTKEIGRKFPQSIKFMTRMGSIQEAEIGLFGPIDEKTFIVPDLELNNSAKLTSLLSSAGVNGSKFLIINEDLLNVFRLVEVGPFQIWPIDIWWKANKLADYYLFHLSFPSNNDWIDFSRTTFELRELNTNEILREQVFGSYDNFYAAISGVTNGKRTIPHAKEIYLRSNGMKSDLVRLSLYFSDLVGYFISEKLKLTIEKQGLTGMDFIPLLDFNKRIVSIY